MSDNGDYPIGYRKPPQTTRFQKGRSGNPKGRPIGSRNALALFDKLLRERVTVKKNGRSQSISKRELVLAQMVNKAASGEWAALRFVVERLIESNMGAGAQEVGIVALRNWLLEDLDESKPGQ